MVDDRDMNAAPTTTDREVAAMFTTTVTPIGEVGTFGEGTFEIRCTCGEVVRYSGQQFTQVEAQRHQAWHQRKASK